MKRLVCEVCGESKIVKQGDEFICENCGMKYSLDQVKSLLVDVLDEKDSSIEVEQVEQDKHELENNSVNAEIKISQHQKKKIRSKSLLVGCMLAVAIITIIIIISNVTLTGKDKVVYDLVAENQSGFKDPSSVQLVSAYYFNDNGDEVAWAQVSAKNGYGASTTSCYYFGNGNMMKSLSDSFTGCHENNVNINKINKKLQKNFDFSK